MEPSDPRSFKCDECPKAFKRKADLGRHILIHDPESAKHRCTVEGCDFKTRQPSNLRLHMNMHQGNRSFACTECNFRTAHPGSLLRHTRGHKTPNLKADSSHRRKRRVAKARNAAQKPKKASPAPTAGPSTVGPTSLHMTVAADEIALVNESSEETTNTHAAPTLDHQISPIIGLLPAPEALLGDYLQSTIPQLDTNYHAPYGVHTPPVEVDQLFGQFLMQNALHVPTGSNQLADEYAPQNEDYLPAFYNQPVDQHHPGFYMEPAPDMPYNEYMTLNPRAPRSLPQDTFPQMIPYWNEYPLAYAIDPQLQLDSFERQDTDDYPHLHDDLSVDQANPNDFTL